MAIDLYKLMNEFQEGNEDSFEIIYSVTSRRIFYTILAIVKDYHLAEDLMQETYIKIRENINKYKSYDKPLAWITIIAKNIALNEYKRRKKETPIDVDENEHLFSDYTIDSRSMVAVDSMLKTLDETERQIVILHSISAFKHIEIAKILDKPLGTVLWIYNRAMKKLKKELNNKEEG